MYRLKKDQIWRRFFWIRGSHPQEMALNFLVEGEELTKIQAHFPKLWEGKKSSKGSELQSF